MPGQEGQSAAGLLVQENQRPSRGHLPAWLNASRFSDVASLTFFGLLYIGTSAAMIAFNKYLVNPDHFPFAIALVLIHSGFSSIFAFFLFLVRPSLFPSLCGEPEERATIDANLVLKGALPIAFLFSIQLVLSNTAYLHLSMAFLQMMKECNLVMVYGFSLIFGVAAFNWMHFRILLLILCATMITIHGELNFSWMGFVIQGSGQLFESLKIVMQAILLSSAGPKLDVLTYVLLVMPLCFVCLSSCLILLVYVHEFENLRVPQWSDIIAWWPFLLANAALAFALNVSIAQFMKNSSAVAFILAGILKDAVIVLAGAVVLGERISAMQGAGFSLQLFFLWIWSMIKIFPEKFENGVWSGLTSLHNGKLMEKRSLLENPETRTEQGDHYGAAQDKA